MMTHSSQQWVAVYGRVIIAIVLSLSYFSCTRRPEKLHFEKVSSNSSLSAVTITPPSALSKLIQSGAINALSVEIIPGSCIDGQKGTQLKKTTLEIRNTTRLESIKVKSKCDYKIFIEMGRLSQNGDSLEKVYLTNISSPTLLKSQNVEGANVKVRATLLITDEGKPLLSEDILTEDPSIPNNEDKPNNNEPQDLTDPKPNGSDGQSLRLDFMRYTVPTGYRFAQTAKDGDTRMASVTRESKRLVLFSRKDRCELKDFLSSSSQVIRSEKDYTSARNITWSTVVSKFSSPFTRKTLYNGVFVFVKNDSCAFGYVSTSSQDTAESEMRAILDGASLIQ
jgi:hypothetical protein